MVSTIVIAENSGTVVHDLSIDPKSTTVTLFEYQCKINTLNHLAGIVEPFIMLF